MNADRKHFAFFLSGLSVGGVPRMTLNLAHALAQRGHRVDLITPRPEGPLRQDVSPPVRVVPLGHWGTRLPWVARKRKRQVLTSLPTLVRYLRHEQPDAVISADHWVNFTAILARAVARVPIRLAISQRMHLSRHAQDKGLIRWLVPRLYPHADVIVAVSNGVAEDLVSSAGLSRERVTTIYNPVVTPDLEERARTPLDHPWFAADAPPVILAVGRLVRQKDFTTLLQAFTRVRRVCPARLMILGDGSCREELTALAEQLGVAADVALPGFVANPYAYMARASVFVLSSAWEGFGNVLVEALACGCPVVSTDCPSGPTEILDGGAYGPLVAVGDDGALAGAIVETLKRPPAAQRLRARAAEYAVGRAADRYLEVLLGQG